ncbi:MAG: rhodanese-like domain-containing protein [Pelagibacterales bacterium]|jgi:rhodanese-related sulfurtransferase|nr:rhodanese-like domain-containing protein [Pelagibacterales bacterium]
MNRLLLIILLFISCENIKGEFQLLEYQSYKSHIENTSVQLFDVRTPEEYDLGHIKGAVNIDFKNEEIFYRSFEKLDKSKPVYLYCRSGNRSKKSADILIELGFSKVYDLKGGFIEWNLNELK